MNDQTWPSESLVVVTPSDSTVYSPALRQLYVGTGGDVTVIDTSGTTVTFKNCTDGMCLGAFYVSKVKSTGTTASNLVGFK